MRPEGDEPPADDESAEPEDQDASGESEAPEPDPPDPEAPESETPESEAPEYTVYDKTGEEKRKQSAPEPRKPKQARAEEGKPEYKVYKSRPGLRDRFGKPDMAKLRRERGGGGAGGGGLRDRLSGAGGGRKWLRWVLVGIAAWLLLSFVAFAISAQNQKGKLDDSAKDALQGGPDLLAGQNILILGGDRRGDRQQNASGTEGQGPPRADTIMVLHASLTSFRKLSIPRDTFAAIPDCGSQRINASLACNTTSPDGNPASTIATVENFLGIPIHHLVIIDFDGFADLINTLGGVKVDVPGNENVSAKCEQRDVVVAGDVDGGKKQGGVSLGLPAGETTLEGDKALAFARIRKNECDPGEDDTDRAARQQSVLNGIKGRLTDPLRLPYNFVKGPWIGWNAPKAFISDMGAFTLPQLAIAGVFGGSGDTNVLKPSGSGPGGSLFISQGDCRRAVEELTGGEPDDDPECSP